MPSLEGNSPVLGPGNESDLIRTSTALLPTVAAETKDTSILILWILLLKAFRVLMA